MKREIKFRQYVPATDKFHYWGFTEEGVFVGPILDKQYASDSEQYIGLKDMNGLEIYEGDIVEIAGHWDKTEKLIQVVTYNYGTFEPFSESDWGWDAGKCEVIGCIHKRD